MNKFNAKVLKIKRNILDLLVLQSQAHTKYVLFEIMQITLHYLTIVAM